MVKQEDELDSYNQVHLRSLQAMSFLPTFSSVVLEKEYIEHAEKNSNAVELLKTEIKYVLLLINVSDKLLEYLTTKNINGKDYTHWLCPPSLYNYLMISTQELKNEIIELRKNEVLDHEILSNIITIFTEKLSTNKKRNDGSGFTNTEIDQLTVDILGEYSLEDKLASEPAPDLELSAEPMSSSDSASSIELSKDNDGCIISIKENLQKLLMYIYVGNTLSELKFFHYPNEDVKTSRKSVKISELLSKYDESSKNVSIFSKLKKLPKSEKFKIGLLLKEGNFDNTVRSREFLDWYQLQHNDKSLQLSFRRKSFMILLYILNKLLELMKTDTENKGKPGYNARPFEQAQITIENLTQVIQHMQTISDTISIENFIDSFTDDRIFDKIKSITRDLSSMDEDINMVKELEIDTSQNSFVKLRKFFIDKIDELKKSKLGINFIKKHSQFCDERKYFDYLNNMVLHRDELHKKATIVNMIYQQILYEIKNVEGLGVDDKRLCPDINLDFLKKK